MSRSLRISLRHAPNNNSRFSNRLLNSRSTAGQHIEWSVCRWSACWWAACWWAACWWAACWWAGAIGLTNSPVEAQIQPTIVPAGRPEYKADTEWFAISFEGRQVGYERVTQKRLRGLPPVNTATDTSSPNGLDRDIIIQRTRDTRILLQRFGKDMSLTAFQESSETDAGLVYQWSLRRSAAEGDSIQRSGRWIPQDAAYEISELAQATRRTFSMPSGPQGRSSIMSAWVPDYLMNSSMPKRVPVLFPETAAVVEIELRHQGSQSLRTKTGQTKDVQRLEFWPTVDPSAKTTLFVDDTNSVVRSEQPLLGSLLVMDRCDADTALKAGGIRSLDVDLSAIVPVNRPIPNPENWRSIHLQMTVPAPAQLMLPATEFQLIRYEAANQLTITLLKPPAVIEDFSDLPSSTTSPSSEFIRPAKLLTTTDHSVQRLAHAAAGGSSEPLQTCRKMTRYLSAHLKRSSFSTTLSSAATTAKQMRGDCTEHAILLATMMRSYQIPSRVAVGMVYNPRIHGFVAHMWTEAFLYGHWIPFDSTGGSSAPQPILIKLLDSSLNEDQTSAVENFLPLLDVIGRAEIKVITESGF